MTEEYVTFKQQIKQTFGIDLSLYKETQMKRRLTSLRNRRGYYDFNHYFKALENDATLLEEFLDRMTINVSSFYRNPNTWEVLQNQILSPLTKDKKHFKIWSAACSTGEEPYSIAMMMEEKFPDIETSIIATDVNENILKKARRGMYKHTALSELPASYKKKFFTEQGQYVYIKDSLKSMISFKQHDLLKDPPPKDINLILCRNVLIYFTDKAKDRIYHNISHALTTDGALFVGSTEQIFSPQLYDLQLIQTFFYQKRQA